MLIEKIVLEGFLSYRKRQEIDLSQVSTCLVLGRIEGDYELSNGAGKSSLFESIPVNFFGKGSGRADILDSYINDKMSKMYTEVIFKIDNQRFKTIRSKSRNSSAVFEIYIDSTNEDLKKSTWKKTDKAIEEILGLSSKTYSSTIYLNERESLQVITGTSSERKEILRELLNIELYEKATKVCNKRFEDYDKKTQVNSNLIQDKQKQLEKQEEIKKDFKQTETDLKNLKKEQKEKEKKFKEKLEERKKLEISIETEKLIKDQIVQKQRQIEKTSKNCLDIDFEIKSSKQEIENQTSSYNKLKNSIEESVKQKSELKKKISILELTLKSLDKNDQELKEVSSLIKTKTAKRSELESELKVLRTEIKPLVEFLERIEDFESVCPVTELECSVLTKDYKTQLQEEKKKEVGSKTASVESKLEILKEIDSEIKKITQKEIELERVSRSRQTENEKISKLKLELQNIDNSESRFKEKEKEFKEYLEQTEKEIKELDKKKQSLLIEIEDLKKELKEIEAKVDLSLQTKLKKAIEEQNDIEAEINSLKSRLDQVNQFLGELKNELDKLEKMKSEIEHLSKNNEENAKQKKIYQTLSVLLGKDGIQKSIMKDSIPLLEKYTSEFLKIFNDDSEKIEVKFDLDPKRQDGEFKKGGGLDILVLEQDKEPKDLQMYSGGETVRIVFSIVLSLAKLLSMRAGKKHEALIIDEKIAKLDSRGIAQFGEVISEISKIYKQVFIITHIESLKDMINGNEIVVNKTELEGSLVSIS
jgi:exonuclease SbcC